MLYREKLALKELLTIGCPSHHSRHAMTAPKLYGGLAAELTFVGRSCSPKLWRQKPSLPIRQRRFIGLKYIQKTKDAKEAWDQQAAEIEAGKQDSMLKKLEDRGYIHSVVGQVCVGRVQGQALTTALGIERSWKP